MTSLKIGFELNLRELRTLFTKLKKKTTTNQKKPKNNNCYCGVLPDAHFHMTWP